MHLLPSVAIHHNLKVENSAQITSRFFPVIYRAPRMEKVRACSKRSSFSQSACVIIILITKSLIVIVKYALVSEKKTFNLFSDVFFYQIGPARITEQMKSVVALPPDTTELGLTKVLAGFCTQRHQTFVSAISGKAK